MLYKVKGRPIYSECTALSSTRTSAWLVDWISKLDGKTVAIDYGCGRLRYTKYLSETCDKVIAVDSTRQLSRTMIIHGERTTIPEYVEKHLANTAVVSLERFSLKNRFTLALCTNVISAIPTKQSRNVLLGNLYKALRPGGFALIVNQHRNSYFKEYRNRKGAEQHLDGWIVPHDGKAYFYGLVNPSELKKLCVSFGFEIVKSGCKGESGYVLCKRSCSERYSRPYPIPEL